MEYQWHVNDEKDHCKWASSLLLIVSDIVLEGGILTSLLFDYTNIAVRSSLTRLTVSSLFSTSMYKQVSSENMIYYIYNIINALQKIIKGSEHIPVGLQIQLFPNQNTGHW